MPLRLLPAPLQVSVLFHASTLLMLICRYETPPFDLHTSPCHSEDLFPSDLPPDPLPGYPTYLPPVLVCSFKSLGHPGRRFGRGVVIAAAVWTSLHILNITLQVRGRGRYAPACMDWIPAWVRGLSRTVLVRSRALEDAWLGRSTGVNQIVKIASMHTPCYHS